MGRSLLDIFRAARPIKIVPLWMLVGAGALIAPSPVHGATLAIALAGIVGASLAAMHINVVTDAELDAGTKPQLWAWMAANEPAAKRVVCGEFVVAGLSVLWLATKCDFAVAGFVALYTAMGCLYSFNFLCPARPVQTRLKVSWWGHMVSMTAIYVSSWMAGLFSCEAFGWRVLARWGGPFLLATAADYALFVAESAVDAPEERAARLNTLAAKLGRRGSQCVAVVLAAVACAGLVFLSESTTVRVALIPGALLSLAVNTALLRYDARLPARLRQLLLESTFIGSRIYLIGALLALSGACA